MDAINMKTCCGDVRLEGPRILAPGESASLVSTIRLGETVGPLSHWATIKTDHPGARLLEFWTLAEVYPRARIEESPGAISPIFPATSARRKFVAILNGTASDPPPSLDDATFRSGLDATWDGPSRDRALGGGLIERSRPFTVELTGGGHPGRRIDEVDLISDGSSLIRRPITWEVSSAIEASPSSILPAPSEGRRDRTILLHARDGRPFRVLRTSSSLAEATPGPIPRGSAAIHTIRLTTLVVPRGSGMSGELTIVTDNLDQPTVSIPIHFSGVSAQGGTP